MTKALLSDSDSDVPLVKVAKQEKRPAPSTVLADENSTSSSDVPLVALIPKKTEVSEGKTNSPHRSVEKKNSKSPSKQTCIGSPSKKSGLKGKSAVVSDDSSSSSESSKMETPLKKKKLSSKVVTPSSSKKKTPTNTPRAGTSTKKVSQLKSSVPQCETTSDSSQDSLPLAALKKKPMIDKEQESEESTCSSDVPLISFASKAKLEKPKPLEKTRTETESESDLSEDQQVKSKAKGKPGVICSDSDEDSDDTLVFSPAKKSKARDSSSDSSDSSDDSKPVKTSLKRKRSDGSSSGKQSNEAKKKRSKSQSSSSSSDTEEETAKEPNSSDGRTSASSDDAPLSKLAAKVNKPPVKVSDDKKRLNDKDISMQLLEDSSSGNESESSSSDEEPAAVSKKSSSSSSSSSSETEEDMKSKTPVKKPSKSDIKESTTPKKVNEPKTKKKKPAGKPQVKASVPKKVDAAGSESEDDSDSENKEDSKKKGKGDGSSKKKPGDNPRIARLQRFLKYAGIRVKNYKTLWEGCKSDKARAEKLMQLLQERGLKGKPTIAECKKLKKKAEREKEIAELNTSNIINTTGRSRRGGAAASAKPKTPTKSSPNFKKAFSRLKNIVDSEESD